MFKNLCSCSIFLEGNESTSLLDVFSELILHRQEMSRKFSRQQNIKIKPWSRNWRALKRVRSFNLIFVRRSSSILLFSFFEVFKNWHWHLIELALVLYWNLWCCKRRYVTRYNVWKFHHLFACLLSKFRLDYSRQFRVPRCAEISAKVLIFRNLCEKVCELNFVLILCWIFCCKPSETQKHGY